jgi:hypothetical protein
MRKIDDLIEGIGHRLSDVEDARIAIEIDTDQYDGEAVAKAVENLATAILLVSRVLREMAKE